MMATEQKIREDVATSMAERMAEYIAMSATTLRKAAAELGVKGASRGRKADLLTAIHSLIMPEVESAIREHYAKKAQAENFTDGVRVKTADGYGKVVGDATLMPGGYVVTVALEGKNARTVSPSGRATYNVADITLAPKTGRKSKKAKEMCADCGQRPVDPKTAGRDSTLCSECYEYAGWENQHSDDDHDGKIAKTGQGVVGCPVCAEQFDKGAKSIVSMIQHKKARWFAESAEAAGWKITYAFDGSTGETYVKAERDGARISLVWEGRLYIAKRSEFRDAAGCRQLRNASAAVKAVQTPSKADLALAS